MLDDDKREVYEYIVCSVAGELGSEGWIIVDTLASCCTRTADAGGRVA